MGSSNDKSKDSNKMNMMDYCVAPWVIINVEIATGVQQGTLKKVTDQQALRYGGGIPANCIELFFKDMPVLRLTDNAIDVTHNGVVYKATPDLKSVSTSKSSNHINSQGGRVTLAAIDDTFINLVQANKTIRAEVTFKVAFMDNNNNCLAMFTEHKGYIKIPTVTFDPKSGKFEIEFETTNFFEGLDMIPGTRSADSIQQSIWPGDKGLQEVTVDETEAWQVKN